MPVTRKLDSMPLRIPGGGMWPAQDVFVNWREIDSSNVKRIGWDNAGNMYVQYKSDAIYVYYGVSRQRAVAAAYSTSTGRYINTRIRNQYEGLKLGPYR